MAAIDSEPPRHRFHSVGVTHHTAELVLREKVHLSVSNLEPALDQLRSRFGVPDAVILSTCNRFEIYSSTGGPALRQWLLSRCGDFAAEIAGNLKDYRDRSVVDHLFSVAGGLDSQVLGETQILGQVKEAYEAAHRAGMTGSSLNKLFQRALTVGKRLRSDTRLSETPTSVSSVAVRLCEKIFGSLKDRPVLVIGAGEISALAAEQLAERGGRITILSTRRRESAEALARLLSVSCLALEDLPAVLPTADVILSATGSPHEILKREDVRRAQLHRKGRPLFLVDLAVPRDIDPGVESLENVFLYNLDDLNGIADEYRRAREKELPLCREIIAEEVESFWSEVFGAEQEEALRRFHEQIRVVVDQELARAGVDGDSAEALKKSIPNRILSEAFKRSRQPVSNVDRQAMLRALKEFFGL